MATSNLTLAGAVMPFVPERRFQCHASNHRIGIDRPEWLRRSPYRVRGRSVRCPPVGRPHNLWRGHPDAGGRFGEPQVRRCLQPSRLERLLSAPLQVRMSVLGTYVKGGIGPLPPDVQVSFPQQPLELPPNSLVYFNFDVTNTLKPSQLLGRRHLHLHARGSGEGRQRHLR